MNMFARFDENPAMTLQDIKETKCNGRTDGHTDARTDNVKTVYPPQTKFARGIINSTIYSLDFTKSKALYFVTVTEKTDGWKFSLLFLFQGHAIYFVCLV